MAIAPSNNLLSALSQLQGSARPAGASKAPAGGSVKSAFAAQLVSPVQQISAVAGGATTASAAPSQAVSQTPAKQPPIPSRGGYLGQYVNIIV